MNNLYGGETHASMRHSEFIDLVSSCECYLLLCIMEPLTSLELATLRVEI